MPRSLRWGVVVLAILFAPAANLFAEPSQTKPETTASQAAESKQTTKFIRLRKNMQDEPVAMETAIVRYVPASDEGELTVDLIGVVHVGDKSYYDKLNKEFEQYDALLYELVAPPDKRVPGERRREDESLVGMLQRMTKVMLDLETQLDHIDYKKDNFVHADLSPDEMAEKIKERGDDGLTLFLGVAADLLRQQNRLALKRERDPDAAPAFADTDPLTALFDSDGPRKLKLMMAHQFEALEGEDGGLGNTLATILVKDRNEAAMRVFQKEMAKGKKKIGIFYGAAHMPDFERRLKTDFGLKHDSQRWLAAWDLKRQSESSGLKLFLELLK